MALKGRYVVAPYTCVSGSETALPWPCSQQNLPENQCVFIRGFRVAQTFRILPKHLKAAAGPSEPEGYDCDTEAELLSIPAITKVENALWLFSAFI
jgi:hypothetical protein